MLEKINKYKFLLLSLFFLFILCICNNSEASTTVNFMHNDINFSVPVDFELYNYAVVYNGSSTVNKGTYALYNTTIDNIIFDLINDSNFKQYTRVFRTSLENGAVENTLDIYMYDSSSNSFIYKASSSRDYYSNNEFTLVFTNAEVWFRYHRDAGYVRQCYGTYKDFITAPDYDISLSTIENTVNPIKAYSNYFDYKDLKKYEVYISTDLKNFTKMNYETLTDAETGTTQFRFNYNIFKNGVYYFKFLNTETNETEYITYTITNIISNTIIDDNGIPVPYVTYKRIVDNFSLNTQTFSFEDIQNYSCYYSTDPLLDYSEWTEMDIGSSHNAQLNTTEYYFFFLTPKDSEDCTYFFTIYDSKKQQYSDISSLNCNFEGMNEYADKVAGVVEEKESKFDELLNFFKERFGFLTYPFEFISDLLNRILNIEYKEPILRIPELYIPGTEEKIFNGYEYNFNSLLENEAISSIYNIYLIAVDFIIVIGVIVFAKDTIMEVFGNG